MFEGDSLTAIVDAAPYTGMVQAQYDTAAPYVWSNIATSGHTLADMLAEQSVQLANRIRTRRGILILWGGTNDIALVPNTSPSTTYARLQQYAANARALGFDKIVVLTCLPRAAGGNQNFETDRAAYNALIRTNALTDGTADAIADIAADSRIGDTGDNLDTTYYPDQIHLNVAGRQVVVPIVKAAIDSIL